MEVIVSKKHCMCCFMIPPEFPVLVKEKTGGKKIYYLLQPEYDSLVLLICSSLINEILFVNNSAFFGSNICFLEGCNLN